VRRRRGTARHVQAAAVTGFREPRGGRRRGRCAASLKRGACHEQVREARERNGPLALGRDGSD
jgi:hypothetical protein